MRDIRIRTDGREIDGEDCCGLSDEVWNGLYETIMGHPELSLLPRLWKDQWGPEADALLPPSEIETLRRDLLTLEATFSETGTDDEARAFLACLTALCDDAVRLGAALEFVAD